MADKDLDKYYRVEYEKKPPESPKKTFKLPAWIPYPVCWLRAIILNVVLVLSILTARLFGFYGLILSLNGNIAPLVIFGLFGLMIPFVIMAYIHCWLLGKKPEKWPKNLPAPNSLREAITAFSVMILTLAITIAIYLPFSNDLANQSSEVKGQIGASWRL